MLSVCVVIIIINNLKAENAILKMQGDTCYMSGSVCQNCQMSTFFINVCNDLANRLYTVRRIPPGIGQGT